MARKSNDRMLHFPGRVEAETARAWLFVFDYDFDKDWMPKSQCEFEDQGKDSNGLRAGVMKVPEWLCLKKGIDEIGADDDEPVIEEEPIDKEPPF